VQKYKPQYGTAETYKKII